MENQLNNSTKNIGEKGGITPFSLKKDRFFDFIFRKFLLFSSVLIVIVIVVMLITLIIASFDSIKHFGFKFFTTNVWDYKNDIYGALAFIVGTVQTSFLALILSLPFSISIAILLGVYLKNGTLSTFVKTITELLAGIPSVIYGFWGFFFLGPIIRNIAIFFNADNQSGYGILTSSIILAIMIIPYTASISREVIELVPNNLIEAGYGLGATRIEVIFNIIIPYSLSGIFAGVLLSLGRALGETMAVTMLIGNRNDIATSLFSAGNTIASVIANEFNEASGIKMSALIELGFVLMAITFVINFIGKIIIKKMTLE